MNCEKSILLITGSDDYREELTAELKRLGHDVDFAKSGTLSLEMLKEKSYYMVIADEDAEEMPAFAILHRINVLQYDIPFIITAKNPGADDVLLAYELGALDIIDRSESIKEVIASIDKTLKPLE